MLVDARRSRRTEVLMAKARTPRRAWIDQGLLALDAGGRTGGDQGWFLWLLRRPPGAARGDARHLGTRGNRERDRAGGERRREPGRPQQAAATLRDRRGRRRATDDRRGGRTRHPRLGAT